MRIGLGLGDDPVHHRDRLSDHHADLRDHRLAVAYRARHVRRRIQEEARAEARIREISGGENIYSAEVENVLTQHPAVAACAVIGIPSEQWGETVHAVVVLKPGAPATDAALVEHCKAQIAHYKCPRSVEFVAQLPLSGAGKVLKTTLREP